jgi:hypothetical protein
VFAGISCSMLRGRWKSEFNLRRDCVFISSNQRPVMVCVCYCDFPGAKMAVRLNLGWPSGAGENTPLVLGYKNHSAAIPSLVKIAKYLKYADTPLPQGFH